MNHNGHVLKYTTGSLELVQSGPVFVKSIESLRVNRVGGAQSLKVFAGVGSPPGTYPRASGRSPKIAG